MIGNSSLIDPILSVRHRLVPDRRILATIAVDA
jgi:hypothetical protein